MGSLQRAHECLTFGHEAIIDVLGRRPIADLSFGQLAGLGFGPIADLRFRSGKYEVQDILPDPARCRLDTNMT